MADDGIAARLAELSPERRELLKQLLTRKSADARPQRLSRRSGAGPTPLSFAQQRLWFLDQLAPGNPFYNISDTIRFHQEVDPEVVEQSLNEIVRRHEILRTRFVANNGEPLQVIVPELKIPLLVEDLRHLPAGEREARGRELAAEEARRSFVLAEGPLLRAKLVRLEDAEWLLLLSMHHIVSDGWSMGVLHRELVKLYGAYAAGRESPLADLPIQYADYAVWQREWLQGERLAKQIRYWREQLAELPRLELPADRPRPAVASYRGGHESLEVGEEATAGLKRLSQEEGATLFMTLLAGFVSLLHRYTGQEEIAVGTPMAGRNWRETEELVGFFVNTVVLRVDAGGNPSYRELVRRVREVALEAYEHQDVPFEKVVEEVQPERDLSRNPLFQVTFQVFPSERSGLSAEPRAMELVEAERGTAKFDLTLDMWEGEGRIRGRLEYAADLFERQTVRRMVRQLERLLEAAGAEPGMRVGELPLLSAEERAQVLEEWNGTGMVFGQAGCVHEWIEQQAERQPEAVAVVCGREQISYGELNRRANWWAERLRSCGAGPEALVGVCAERTVGMVVALLAVWKAGAAWAPLDPGNPRERLASLLEEMRPAAVLATQASREVLVGAGAPLLWMEEGGEGSDANPVSGVSPENLAYVIYTSGSTGRPKGVMISHRSLANLVQGLRLAIYHRHATGPLRVSVNGPLTFDTSVKQIVQLCDGHALHIVPEEVRRDPDEFVAYLRESCIDVLDCTPSQFRGLIDSDLFDVGQRYPGLVLAGGEPINAPLWADIQRCGTAIFNMYGPTECTVDATACRIEEALAEPSIGRPIANMQAYILDSHMQPITSGILGQLYLGGDGVGRGYLGDPAGTAARFLPHPFAASPGARLYRTGDMVRRLPNGTIQFAGRADRQVKLRGRRIEPGEIEAALERHPQVHQAVVVTTESTRLIAYVTPVPVGLTADTAREELREFLRKHLPEYMIPYLLFLNRFPLTVRGKIDRAALPDPVAFDNRVRRGGGGLSATETNLFPLWSEVLGVPAVGLEDDFFRDLGGHSLLAVQLVARVRNQFRVEIPIRLIFESPTIAELGRAIDDEIARTGKRSVTTIPLRKNSDESFAAAGEPGDRTD